MIRKYYLSVNPLLVAIRSEFVGSQFLSCCGQRLEHGRVKGIHFLRTIQTDIGHPILNGINDTL